MHRFFLHLSLHAEICRSRVLLFLHLAQACKVLVAVELLSVREVGIPKQAARKLMWVFVGITTSKETNGGNSYAINTEDFFCSMSFLHQEICLF